MKDILNHSQGYNYNWASQLKDYTYNKSYLGWDKNVIPEKITAKMVKSNDLVYNPILQKYNDSNFENSLKQKERIDLIDNIVKNQDNQLKVEQTFDIINLHDRLKGFEKEPNYPVTKDLINKRKKIECYPKNFNIISNYPISQHHFDKPENRQNCNISEPKKVRIKYNFSQDRDYDIISTRYKHYNEEKNAVDKEIKKIQTAKIFYKNNDYNPIKGVFFNQAKEKAYQERLKEEQKNWGIEKFKKMPKCAKGKSDVYNLITLKIVDPQEMNKIIQGEKNSKQRYEIRYKMENYYRERCMVNQDKDERKKNGKADYLRYKEEDNRQYNIIDLMDKPFKEHNSIAKTGGMNDWQKLIKGASSSNTFNSKSIYKDPYDYSESGFTYDSYKINRNKTLTNLPKIEEDKFFNQHKKLLSKCASSTVMQKKGNAVKGVFDKQKFFKSPPKSISVSDFTYEYISSNKELNGKKTEFDNNKEKNMRNLRRNLNFETTNSKNN